jgi:hypothetical protein
MNWMQSPLFSEAARRIKASPTAVVGHSSVLAIKLIRTARQSLAPEDFFRSGFIIFIFPSHCS